MTLKSKLSVKETVGTFISTLFFTRNQVHAWHLIVGPNAFAIHSALDKYYNGIVPIVDEIVENYQGLTGKIIRDYTNDFKYENMLNPTKEVIIAYFKDLHSYIDNNRQSIFTDSAILNIIDEAKSLVQKTIYKLERL